MNLKKVVALILTVVMCLSFTACNLSKDKADEIPECDFSALYNEYQDNKLTANENYVGKTYRFAGTVIEIENNYISLAPIQFLKKPYSNSYFLVKVYMSKEDIKKVSVFDVVNVSGKISVLQDSTNDLVMTKGNLIDDIISFEGELYETFVTSVTIKEFMLGSSIYSSQTIYYHCPTEKSGEYITEHCVINGVEYTKGDYVKGKAKMKATASYDRFDIVELMSIEKSQ